jgi:uncharacterized repeat protein (TIGR01451 family)
MDRTGDNRMCHTLTDQALPGANGNRTIDLRLGLNALTRNLHAFVLAALVLSMAISAGCQTLSLPAIDPTGNRIFTNQFTTILTPHDPNNGYPSTQPAFQAPPEPPPCIQGANGTNKKLCKGCLAGKGCLARKKEAEEIRGRCGQLLLTPTRIVAPVRGEVVLLAGVCGKDEYLVTNEPIEWMLSPNGVGEIVEVGDDTKGQRKSHWKKETGPKVEKLDVDFARGRTSREAGRITRGTSDPTDDLPIRKGQTWISLTSASEGVTNVTALAPDSDVWDKRRQTATIYWVDASWVPPREQFVKSGERVPLVTQVMKAEGVSPATGWIVRYRVTDDQFARFMPSQQPSVDVVVDRDGKAVTEIVHESKFPFGTAIVEVEVIRPAQGDKLPEVTVFRGTTTVTWSAPQLTLEAFGPEVGTPGQPLGYVATVKNLGDMVAENVVVSVVIPNGMRLDPTTTRLPPDAQTNPQVLQWVVGPLDARQRLDINFSLIASAELDARVQFEATSAGNRPPPVTVPTIIQKPLLTLALSPFQNRSQVEVGNEAAFDVIVTNTGNQTINDVTVAIKSDPGLQHVRDGQNEMSQVIPFLNPGQPFRLNAVFVVQREGQLGIEGSLLTMNQIVATQRASITGLPARPKTPSVSLNIPNINPTNTIAAGTRFTVSWLIENNGAVTLRSPRVLIQHDRNLQANALSQGVQYSPDRQLGEWRLNDLLPGGRIELQGEFIALNPSEPSNINVDVETVDGVRDRKTLSLQVVNSGVGGSSPNDLLPNQPGGGLNKPAVGPDNSLQKNLDVTIRPVSNSIKKGEVGTYEIRIENLRSQSDQRVSLQLMIPEGSSIVSISPKEMRYKLTNKDRQVDVEPIQYFRPKDSFSCVIQLKHNQSGSGELLAGATSMGQTTPTVQRLAIQVRP